MAAVHVLDHPLIHHKLAVLRNKETPVKEFRELISEIAGLTFPVQACKHPPAASLFSPAFRALGSKPGTKVLPGAH